MIERSPIQRSISSSSNSFSTVSVDGLWNTDLNLNKIPLDSKRHPLYAKWDKDIKKLVANMPVEQKQSPLLKKRLSS